ncbi:hypothetical protein BRDID11002_15290 [Bradyrhizobium diazoefficiens]
MTVRLPRTVRARVPGLIVVKRLVMQGFIVMDYMKDSQRALAELQGWVQNPAS